MTAISNQDLPSVQGGGKLLDPQVLCEVGPAVGHWWSFCPTVTAQSVITSLEAGRPRNRFLIGAVNALSSAELSPSLTPAQSPIRCPGRDTRISPVVKQPDPEAGTSSPSRAEV